VESISEVVSYLRNISPLWDNKTDTYIGDMFEKEVDEEDLDRY